MKRFWLPLCFACLVLIMGGLGIYREASIRLSHALTRFRTALPAGAQFQYGHVRPAILNGGITLSDVSFHYQNTSFHAQQIRLGYPKLLSNGTLSLASLLLESPSYTNKTHTISAARAAFRHLNIPSSAETLHEARGEADSMHSLAAIMSFEPEDITALRFQWMQLNKLIVTTPSATAQEVPSDAPAPAISPLHSLTADKFTLEGYGLGSRVRTSIDGLDMSLSLEDAANTLIPPVLLQPLLPNDPEILHHSATSSPLEINLSLHHLDARQGSIHWLKRPLLRETDGPEAFWSDPAECLWEKPGRLNVEDLAVLIGKDDKQRHVNVNHILAERREERNDLHTEADIQGATTLLTPPLALTPVPLTPPSNFHLSTYATKNLTAWHETVNFRTSFNQTNNVKLTAHINLPNINPLHPSGETIARFLQNGRILNANLDIEGTDFFTYYGIVNTAAAPTDNEASPQAASTPPLGRTVTPRVSALALRRPVLAPMLDFLLSPAQRTLTITTGALTLADLAHIPVDADDDELVDQLHILSVTAHKD